ncbi:hypothetical protein L1887_33252 [Cichorium endivia]|nr:hypothetical protein L1887_33252 [Cichorium endivia]
MIGLFTIRFSLKKKRGTDLRLPITSLNLLEPYTNWTCWYQLQSATTASSSCRVQPHPPSSPLSIAQLSMAEGEEIHTETVQSSFPAGRVKRIMKLDKDINKINSDALFVISNATELFIKFLAEKSSEVAIEKKKKTIKLEHMRIAVKRHQPTADFLLDSLPMPAPAYTSSKPDRSHKSSGNNSVPVGTRRIDSFFQKGS